MSCSSAQWSHELIHLHHRRTCHSCQRHNLRRSHFPVPGPLDGAIPNGATCDSSSRQSRRCSRPHSSLPDDRHCPPAGAVVADGGVLDAVGPVDLHALAARPARRARLTLPAASATSLRPPGIRPPDTVDVVSSPFRFDNSFVRDLPGLYEHWTAVTASSPTLLALNDDLARDLGVEPALLRSPEGTEVLVGNVVPDGAEPVAQAYAGHQFGGFSPRLGDGRALLLGEVLDEAGGRHDLHLKGSGRTPFARGGDGLAAVGPMLREFLMCEAMHALGVPTTRALAVVGTGDDVRRETLLPGAVFVRVASSHLRVGTFQYAASLEDSVLLTSLVDHAIRRHHADAGDAESPALALLEAVMDAQVELIARWMTLGFIHGVMNTDNVTISGEAIDFGPCAFMETYDPATVFSSIDHGGRYAYGNQPSIGQWNLARLAEPLLPLIDEDLDVAIERATELLQTYPDRFHERLARRAAEKLGLGVDDVAVPGLYDDLLALMHDRSVDFTNAWRRLSDVVRGDDVAFRSLFAAGDANGEALDGWLDRFAAARGSETRDEHAAAASMDAVNPIYIPRNHLVEAALAAATAGDLAPFEELSAVLADPFFERDGLERFAQPAPADFTSGYQTFCGT